MLFLSFSWNILKAFFRLVTYFSERLYFFGMQGRVTTSMRQWLERPFIREEINCSLFSMHPSKALGLDGFHTSFLSNFLEHHWRLSF